MCAWARNGSYYWWLVDSIKLDFKSLVSPVGMQVVCYIYLMAPPYPSTETDREFWTPPSCTEGPEEHDTCVEEPRCLSHVLASGFPGEWKGGMLVPPLPPLSSLSCSQSYCAPRLPTYPWAYGPPCRHWTWPVAFSAKWGLFKIMFDALTSRTKTL